MQAHLLANPCDCGEPSVSVKENACARCLFLDGHQNGGHGGRYDKGSEFSTQIIETLRHEGECTVRHLAEWLGKHTRAVVRSLHELERAGRVFALEVDDVHDGVERGATGGGRGGSLTKVWRLVDGHERYRASTPPAPHIPGWSWVFATLKPLGFARASTNATQGVAP